MIALRNFVLFVQFRKLEKHPWRSVTLSEVACLLLKVILLHGCFSRFLNCADGAKSLNASHITMNYASLEARKKEIRVKCILCHTHAQTQINFA